ncbi:glycosyltransferase family 4 protein [Sphingomonas sp.]|uniref:glycosyltransferase family 4 protein n=1 Tax=Sphingomonas sp. TaxID=28214 RepID=UPI0025F01BC7|nr:glycosyltransferase family 4 protein [Sphingomonas sp.]
MTHYPRNAQTFIAGEIDGVRAAGVEVACFAMNRPDARELAVVGAQEKASVTTYLKDSPLGAIGDALAITLRHPVGMSRIIGAAINSGGGSVRRTIRRLAHLAQAARLARVAKAQGVRHLHAHFALAPATIAWFASRMMSLDGQPVGFSFTIHGFHDFVDPGETRLDLKAHAADAVVCISDFTRGQLFLNSDPAVWPRARVIRCGIDLAAWQFATPERVAGAPTIVALGRLSAEKGFGILIEALAQLQEAKLRLVGDGPQRAVLTALADRLGVSERVTFVGELPPEQVRAELRAADIFCLPSFSEGLPVSIMEAMAAGVPVVATWIAGIPELAQDGVTALTVPPARVDALAEALRRLADDPALGRKLADAARARVEAHHDQAINGRAMADLLRSLVA